MFSRKKNISNHPHDESRDVTLDDIATISSDMTECIKRSSMDRIPQATGYDDGYDYSDAVTPPLTPEPSLRDGAAMDVPRLTTAEYAEEGVGAGVETRGVTKDMESQEEPTEISPLADARKTVKELILDIKGDNAEEEEVTHTRSSSNERSPRKKREKKHRTHRRRGSYTQETSDNHDRKELLWTTKIENVLKGWHNKCLKNADWHAVRAKHHKKIFYSLGIPASIIPMALAAASEVMGDDWKIFVVVSLIVTGVLNIVAGFLNPGKKAEAHLNFNALYNELAVEITSELVKPQSYRGDADVFIQRIMDAYNSLNNRAPAS